LVHIDPDSLVLHGTPQKGGPETRKICGRDVVRICFFNTEAAGVTFLVRGWWIKPSPQQTNGEKHRDAPDKPPERQKQQYGERKKNKRK